MSAAFDFSELPRAISIAIGAFAGIYFKDSIPGPDALDGAVGALLGAKAYDFANGDTSLSLPMDTGALLGAAAAGGAALYPMGFDLSMAVPAAAGVADVLGSMFL